MANMLKGEKIWNNISDNDFENEFNIIEDNLAQYNLEKMKIFSANINYFRQLLRLSDSLKPVERRLLYTMYLSGAKPNTKTQKSNRVIGNSMVYHGHGDCLHADTKFLLANGDIKTIKELYNEDKVQSILAINKFGNVVRSKAHSFRIGQYTKRIYNIHFLNSAVIKCTDNHPFMVFDLFKKCITWVKAKDLKKGDAIYSKSFIVANKKASAINYAEQVGSRITKITIDEIESEEPMYDFTVDNLENGMVITNINNNNIVNTVCVHNSSIYKSLVGMAQPWKKQVPLIKGTGNFGNDAYPDQFAQSRYTESLISNYAYECFFEDYDEDCVEMILNTAVDGPEPLSLPAKFPNILINGGFGIAIGNAFRIPPYNIYDIISLCKRLIQNPDHPDIYIAPDLPTGCSIVDQGDGFKEICDTGEGTLTMRSDVEIIDAPKKWILKYTNIPWMCSLSTIKDKIVQLTKDGILPIKDSQDKSYQIKTKDGIRMIIDYRVIIDKAHDPYVIRDRLYKLTDLERTVGVGFKVVLEGFSVAQLNMRELVLSWIDERREYKRRLLNKRIIKINSRISLLEILIHLLDKDNINKTVNIIKNSDSKELVSRLKELGGMSSFQATKIAEMKLNAFTKDAREKYIAEKAKLEKDLDATMELIKSEKKIDKIIMEELDDLKKYASPRKSKIIAASSGIEVAKTDHIIITTKQGFVKKLLYNPLNKSPNMGVFKNLDYPTNRLVINNMDSIIFFDSLGRFTRMPVYEINNTESSSHGNSIYDVAKLDGEIVSVFPDFNKATTEFINDKLQDDVTLVTLTKDGYMKKTLLSEYTKLKNIRNIRAMKLKPEDSLVYADLILDSANVLVYTKKGKYAFIKASDIALQSKDSMGLLSVKLDDDDECVGLNVIGDDDEYLLVITEKGNMKKCELAFMGSAGKRKVSMSYISALDANDNVIYVNGIKEKSEIFVCTRNEYFTFKPDDIPTLTRRAKCQKKVPIPVGSNIISIEIK